MMMMSRNKVPDILNDLLTKVTKKFRTNKRYLQEIPNLSNLFLQTTNGRISIAFGLVTQDLGLWLKVDENGFKI